MYTCLQLWKSKIDITFAKLVFLKSFQNCNVCGEHQIVEEFCNATICRQCKSYFALQMRRHRLYTLRCNHPPTLDLTGEIDFSCRCCRLEKCRQVGMIDEFQYQLKVSWQCKANFLNANFPY